MKREAAALRRRREGSEVRASIEEKTEVEARMGKRGITKAREGDRACGQFHNSKHVT